MDIDSKVRELFAKLEARKAKITSLKAEIAKSWKTNCTFRLLGAPATTNVQTANVALVEEIATHLSIIAGARDTAAAVLKRDFEPKIQGYAADDWFSDLNKRLATIVIRDEEEELARLEARLNQVLSPEERRRIEVELLAKEL